MQNILSKKSLSVLSWSKTLRINPSTLTSLLTCPLSRANTLTLTNNSSFYFASEGEKSSKFDNTPSFDGIINSISNAENANQVLDAFVKAGQHYRNEQVVLSMRMLARLIRTINRQESISNDERFIKLQERMKEGFESYSDHELLDLLFWLRKFRMFKINLAIPDRELSRIFIRVNEFVKSKTYSCRNLINIYFDYCHMKQATDTIVNEILNDIKADSKILTTFSCIQIIQAASFKDFLTQKDTILLNQIIRSFSNFEQDFDIEQKSTIFKHLSKVELNFNPPRFQVPNVLYRLKEQLKEKIEQLSELSVNNIIDAYENLPKEFPTDLLEEIKEMICVTLQHNPKNIKSLFLLDIYDSLSNLKVKKRRMNEQKLAIIDKEMIERLKEKDADLLKPRSLETLLDIYSRAQKGDEGINAIYELFLNQAEVEGKGFGFFFLEIFAKQKLDIRKFLDIEIIKERDFKRTYNTVRLYNLLHFTKNEKYESNLKELEDKVNDLVLKEPANVCKCLFGAEINWPLKVQLYEKLIVELQNRWGDKTLNNRFYFRLVYESCASRNIKIEWIKFIQSKADQISKEEPLRNAIIDSLGMIDEPQVDAFQLLLTIFDIVKPTANDLKRLLNMLKENKKFISTLDRNDQLMQRFAKLLNDFAKDDVTRAQMRLVPIYTIALKLNALRPRNMLLFPVLEKMIIVDNVYETLYQMQAAVFLMNKKALSSKTAEGVLKRMSQMKSQGDIITRIRLFNQSLTLEQALLEANLVTLQNNYALIKENLNNPNARQVLSNLAVIMGFPPHIIKEDLEFIKKTLTDYIQQGNNNSYMSLLKGFSYNFVMKEKLTYIPFIKEIVNNFNTFSPKMPYTDVLDCLHVFSRIGVRNPSIYNLIIENIGRNFNSTRLEDLISILKDFSYVGLKQIDLFDKVLQKLSERSGFAMRAHFGDVVSSLYAIGFDSEYVKKEFLNIVTNVGILNGPYYKALVVFLNYLPILETADEESLLENHINRLVQNISASKQTNMAQIFNTKSFYLNLLYLKFVYKKRPDFIQKLEIAISAKEGLGKVKSFSKTLFESRQGLKSRELVENYLKVMKIEYKTDFKIDELQIDIFIPSTNTIIKVLSMNDLNYDKKSYRGSAFILKKIYESLTDYKTVMISISDMNANPDHLSKVKYLQELGIKSPVSDNEFDFTNLKTLKPPVHRGREQQKEQIVESDSESADDEIGFVSKKVEAVLDDMKDPDLEAAKKSS